MKGRIQERRIRIRRSPSVAASLLTELNPFLVNVTGQSGYELNGLSSGASNVCIGSFSTEPADHARHPMSAFRPVNDQIGIAAQFVAMGQQWTHALQKGRASPLSRKRHRRPRLTHYFQRRGARLCSYRKFIPVQRLPTTGNLWEMRPCAA